MLNHTQIQKAIKHGQEYICEEPDFGFGTARLTSREAWRSVLGK
jgi:hypothetical protein